MKKIYQIILVAIIGLMVVVSCQTKQKLVATLAVSFKGDMQFSAKATESFMVVVATDEMTWEATSDQTWCIVTTDVANKKFTVTAQPHVEGATHAPAVITVTSPNTAPVTINVTQTPIEVEPAAVVNKCSAIYEGDAFGLLRDVLFTIHLYNGEFGDENFLGLQVHAFTSYQTGPNFELPAGEYRMSTKGDRVFTVYPGQPTAYQGCFEYTLIPSVANPGKFTQVYSSFATDGKMIVARQGNVYTISVDFTAIDAKNYLPRKNIKYTFTGEIAFEARAV